MLRRDTPGRGEAGFDALFLAHYEGVFRICYRIAGTREEAEDLAQETFLRLHRTPRLWQQPGAQEDNVRGWLYRVATNLALNMLRAATRRRGREERAFREDPHNEYDGDPGETVVRSEARAAVRRVLAQLPERQALLLLLRHAGLSYKELAGALGIAPGSVGQSLARAEAAFEAAYRKSRQ